MRRCNRRDLSESRAKKSSYCDVAKPASIELVAIDAILRGVNCAVPRLLTGLIGKGGGCKGLLAFEPAESVTRRPLELL